MRTRSHVAPPKALRVAGLVFSFSVVLPGCPSPGTRPLPPLCTTPAAIDPTVGCAEADSGCVESVIAEDDGGTSIARACPMGASCASPGRLLPESMLFAGQASAPLEGCCTVQYDPSGSLLQTDCPQSPGSLDCFGVTETFPDGGTEQYSNGC